MTIIEELAPRVAREIKNAERQFRRWSRVAMSDTYDGTDYGARAQAQLAQIEARLRDLRALQNRIQARQMAEELVAS